MMFRTIGAAVSAPNPPCSTVATTMYSGCSAGTMPANHEVSWNGGRSAVPVCPRRPAGSPRRPRTPCRRSSLPERVADVVELRRGVRDLPAPTADASGDVAVPVLDPRHEVRPAQLPGGERPVRLGHLERRRLHLTGADREQDVDPRDPSVRVHAPVVGDVGRSGTVPLASAGRSIRSRPNPHCRTRRWSSCSSPRRGTRTGSHL